MHKPLDERMGEDLQYLKDRQDILDYFVRECRGRDWQDTELTASPYWPDGKIAAGYRVTTAPDTLAANAGHAATFAAAAHNITNQTCQIEGDTAYGVSSCVGGLLSKDEASSKWVGSRYIDQLERRYGEWWIKLRRNSIEMVAEGNASWLMALVGFLCGSWSKADPSYFGGAASGERRC